MSTYSRLNQLDEAQNNQESTGERRTLSLKPGQTLKTEKELIAEQLKDLMAGLQPNMTNSMV